MGGWQESEGARGKFDRKFYIIIFIKPFIYQLYIISLTSIQLCIIRWLDLLILNWTDLDYYLVFITNIYHISSSILVFISNTLLFFWFSILLGKVKKNIESVIMIIPRRTPPLFFENCDRLRFFVGDVFFINWVIQVCLEKHFWYVWNKLWLGKASKKNH